MNKARAKNILHWVGFVAVVAAAVYIAVIAKGLGVVERVTLAATTLTGLFVALAKVFPVLDKTVDETLPDDAPRLPPPSPNTPVVCLLALGSLLLASSCSSAKTTPADGVRIAVQCAQTACDSVPPGPCERLIASAISCLVSAGNTAVCLGGVPALVQVGYADLVCVVDALAIAHDDKQIRESANKWMRSQNVDVIR